MNTRLNKKVKKDLDAYFKGFRGSDPEEIGRAHVRTPVTSLSRMPSSA